MLLWDQTVAVRYQSKMSHMRFGETHALMGPNGCCQIPKQNVRHAFCHRADFQSLRAKAELHFDLVSDREGFYIPDG